MTIYRKIWTEHFGIIPEDKDGKSYEIHHIDGNNSNNDISNLKCVSIQEHYDIHYSQEDWGACYKIMKRMSMTKEQISEIATKHNNKQVELGIHPWMTRPDGSSLSSDRVKDGSHNFLGGEIVKKTNEKRLNDGTHKFLDKEWAAEKEYKKLENGTHPFIRINQERKEGKRKNPFSGGDIQRKMIEEGTHPCIVKVQCPHCDKIGNKAPMYAWHFDKCRFK